MFGLNKKSSSDNDASGLKTLDDSNARIMELETLISDLKSQLNSANDTIEDLQNMLDKKPVSVAEKLVTHNGDQYKIIIPRFRLGEENFTTEDVEKDPELLNRLIEMGSGVIQKI